MRARTTRFLGATAVAACACLVMTGTASAVGPANELPETIALVGSDTTFSLAGAIAADANAAAWNTDPDNFVNVPPLLGAGESFTVPADPFFDEVVYNGTNPPPNGSSQGKAALKASAEVPDGKIDIARSSSGRSASDPATFEYTAFATDGVTWASSATGSGAGLTLTLAQLRGIYDGSITNWNQVGGADAAIVVYLPQTGSGTLSFFTGTVLGFDPTTKPVTIKRFQEHSGSSIPAADQANAIAPYSIAEWIAQGNGVTTDLRSGFTVNPLTGAGFDGSPAAGSAGAYTPVFTTGFLGSRSVYHVLDTRTPSYDQAKRGVSYDDGDTVDTASPLCGGKLETTVKRYGFLPIVGANGLSCTKA